MTGPKVSSMRITGVKRLLSYFMSFRFVERMEECSSYTVSYSSPSDWIFRWEKMLRRFTTIFVCTFLWLCWLFPVGTWTSVPEPILFVFEVDLFPFLYLIMFLFTSKTSRSLPSYRLGTPLTLRERESRGDSSIQDRAPRLKTKDRDDIRSVSGRES